MPNQFFDPEDAARQRAAASPTRPEREPPRPISELRENTPLLVPTSKTPKRRNSKEQVDRVVRRLLPILGFFTIVGLIAVVGLFIAGVYF